VRASLRLVAGLVALMWALELVDLAAGGRLDRLGIEPREADGLLGILLAPLLHVGFGHLADGLRRLLAVLAVVALVGGLGVWLLAPAGTVHLGASGLVFGLAAYLLARALWTRRLVHLAIAAVVAVVWGGALLGGLLPQPGVSWQGHAFGAVGGLLAARWLGGRRPGAARSRR
jgi:membrane associated rhomboid family serine protease